MTIKEIKIQYDEDTREININCLDDLYPSSIIEILGNALSYSLHEECEDAEITKEQRTEVLEAIFDDMQDHLSFLDKKEEEVK